MSWPTWSKSWGKSWGGSWGYIDQPEEQEEQFIGSHGVFKPARRPRKSIPIPTKLKRSMKEREKEFPVII